VTVKAVITGPGGESSTVHGKFSPNTDGKIDDQLSLDFGSSTVEGAYTIVVSATEPGNTYTSQTLHVKVDVVSPKFLDLSPNANAFVKGIVKIRGTIKETNIKSWEVKVNNQSIPNNTGSTNNVIVNWDTSGIERDGVQTITVTAKDQAGNEETKSVSVTLDRTKPVVTIGYPRSDTNIKRGVTIPVLVDITDASTTSVTVYGVDVLATTTDGTYLARVARISYKGVNATTSRWTGRIRADVSLPKKFKIVVTTIDRAGNQAVKQEVPVTIR